jgi:diguanylate cyclase (GGDEF)-like protein
MTALKTDRIYNTLYLSLAMAVLLLLLLIFFVRAYIEQQLRKQAILDGETGLYNDKFCHATLRKRCAQAERNGLPLSLISFAVDGLEEGATRYTSAQREKLLKKTGDYLKGIVRESDVPCRDGGKNFLLILPDTSAEGAEILAMRVQEGLQRELGEEFSDLSMKLETRTKGPEETCEEFLD